MVVERIIAFADLDSARKRVVLTHAKRGRRSAIPAAHHARIQLGESWGTFLHLSVAEVYVLVEQGQAFLDAVRNATCKKGPSGQSKSKRRRQHGSK